MHRIRSIRYIANLAAASPVFIIGVNNTKSLCEKSPEATKSSKLVVKKSKESDDLYDVIVIGLGGHGSAAAAHLAKRGAKVLGLEQFSSESHAHGSSHGRSRIIRQAYFEDPRYVPLLKRSFELWADLEAERKAHFTKLGKPDSEPLLTMTGGLMIGLPTSTVVTGALLAAKKHSLPHKILNAEEVRRKYPTFHLKPEEIAVEEEQAGYLVPEECVTTHRRCAEQAGAQLQYEEEVTGWEETSGNDNREDKKIIVVKTKDGKQYKAKKIILSVGAWAPQLYGSLLPSPLYVVRRVLYWFDPTVNNRDQVLKDWSKAPIYIWGLGSGEENEQMFYGFPYQKGIHGEEKVGVKVAMHIVANTDGCDPQTINRKVSVEETQQMKSVLQSRLPSLASGKLVTSATCMYTCTQDAHFVIDFMDAKTKNVIIANACSGHGFKFCSVVGEILADLAIDEKTRHDISLFAKR